MSMIEDANRCTGPVARHTCLECSHCRAFAEDEYGHYISYECLAIPGSANLSTFPFKNTTCLLYKPRGRPARHTGGFL
jgi:hypothetical protein